MYPQEFCKFYLESKNIAIVNEQPNKDGNENDLHRATKLTMNFSGINPVKLATYPTLLTSIEGSVGRSSNVKNIEDTFMKRLVNCLHDTRSLAAYIEELLQSKDAQKQKLGQRILSLTKEVEECAICYVNDSNTFFQCGHRVCSPCSGAIQDCPFCRDVILKRLQEIEDKDKEANVRKTNLPRFQLVEDLPKFVESRFSGLLKRSSTLDSSTSKELSTLIQFFPKEMYQLYKNNVNQARSEEIICYLSAKFFQFLVLENNLTHTKWTEEQSNIASFLASRIKTPSRLIRFLTAMASDEAVKDKPVKLKINNKFRTWIVGIINQFDLEPAEIEMNQRKGFWVWLFKKLHIKQPRWNKYPTAQSLADFARSNRKQSRKSDMHEFNQLYKNSDAKLLQFFEEKPGLCFRFFRCSLVKLQTAIQRETWLAFLQRVLPKFKPQHLVELLHILEAIPSLNLFHPVVYRVKNGELYWNDKFTSPSIQQDLLAATTDLIKNHIKVSYKLVVDTAAPLNTLRLARGRPPKVPEWVPQVSATGDILRVDPNEQVVIFVHWMNGADRVDLDLSVMLMGQGNKIGKVDYCCLNHSSVTHSGDYTDAPPPNGCSEYITFCPASVMKANSHIDELYVLCFSFNAVPFDNMGQAFVGIGVLDSDAKGQGPGGCRVLSGCELRGDCEVNFTSKFNFRTNEFTFLNTNVTSKRGAYSVGSASRQVSTVSQNFSNWLNTRAPATFAEVVDTLYLGAKQVQLVGNTNKQFTRREGESNTAFQLRVKKAIDDDMMTEDDKSSKICFFGNAEGLAEDVLSKWPKDSMVISKKDPQVSSNVIWSTDPYSVFN